SCTKFIVLSVGASASNVAIAKASFTIFSRPTFVVSLIEYFFSIVYAINTLPFYLFLLFYHISTQKIKKTETFCMMSLTEIDVTKRPHSKNSTVMKFNLYSTVPAKQ